MRKETKNGKIIYWMKSDTEEAELNREEFMDLHYRGKAEMIVEPWWNALGEKRYRQLLTPWNICKEAFFLPTCGRA